MNKLPLRTIFILILLPLSCITSANWWQTPPLDNELYIYGMGEGQTLALAQQQALADISGKLSTQISASLNRVTQDTGIVYNDNVRRTINSEIAKVELSQFQLLKSHQQNNTVFALLQLDRKKLAEIWQQQLSDILEKLEPLLIHPPKSFADWQRLQLSIPDAVQARNLSVRLFALNGTKPIPDKHSQLTQHLLRYPLTVNVTGNNTRLNRAIEDYFTIPGLTRCAVNCQLTVSYQIESEHDSLFGEYISDTKVVVTLKENNMVQRSTELTAQVTSVSGYKSADEGSIRTIINQLQQSGFWPLFGMPL